MSCLVVVDSGTGGGGVLKGASLNNFNILY